MSCNCVNELKEKLKTEYGSEIELMNIEYRLMGDPGTQWPSLMLRYHPNNLDGTKSKKWKNLRIFPTYCPVCGKKYDGG